MMEIFVEYGPLGMFVAAFLAGSFFPFSSEAIMIALLALDINPWKLIIWGTIGNVLGSVVNYGVGRLGKEEWIEKYLHVKPEQMQKAQKFMQGHGALMGFFAFIPVLGSAITIVLGLMRANVVISFLSITTGKLLRYILIAYGAMIVEWLVGLFAAG